MLLCSVPFMAFAANPSAAVTPYTFLGRVMDATHKAFDGDRTATIEVAKARDAQKQTQEAFQNALQQFGAVVNYDGGDLQKEYNRLSKELERCEGRADDVKDRIDAVEKVAKDLFKEWKKEIGQYQNASYRADSEKKLRATQQDCDRMLEAMRTAQERIEPVLSVFRDQVLYLKHNLNARAIASLKGETAKVETDVARLVADLNQAIEEADRCGIKNEAYDLLKTLIAKQKQ